MSDSLALNICTPFPQFHSNAIAAIRSRIDQVKDFQHGAIGALYVPSHPDAYRWLGLPIPSINTPDNDRPVSSSYIIRVDSVTEEGSMIREAGWRGVPECPPVDCGAFVQQKLFACLRAMRTVKGYASDKLPDALTIKGQHNGKGAVGYTIIPCERSSSNSLELVAMGPGLMIVYGVSGATGIENEWCANASQLTVLSDIGNTDSIEIYYDKRYDPDQIVREGKVSLK